MSFVDLPFQEHRMMKKYHMDQNPYISSLCPKLGVVSDNRTRGDDVAKSPGPIEIMLSTCVNMCHVKSVRIGSEV
jgi:hypothetical protein